MNLSCGNSLREECPILSEDGGSIPTLPLHKRLWVEECNSTYVKDIIERLHYSHSVFGVTVSYAFRVWDRGNILVGGALFGAPAAFNVSRKYDKGEPLVELRRFVLSDNLPKNSESFCLAVMLRRLRKVGIKRILSYADPAHGHTGVIYAAAGFKKMGKTASRKHIKWKGSIYPDRNIHQINFPYHKELRKAIQSGEASKIAVPGKIIWLATL